MGGVQGFGPTTRNGNGARSGGLATRAVPQTTPNPSFTSVDPAAQTAPRAQGPTLLSYVPLASPTPKVYGVDVLTLTENAVVNGKYVPVPKSGISSYRPEILLTSQYIAPLDKDGHSLTSFGKLLDVNYQSRLLRADTLAGIHSAITGSEVLGPDLRSVESQFSGRLNAVQSSLRHQIADHQEMEALSQVFEIKQIPDTAYDTSKYLTLKSFFNRRMQYQPALFFSFSETKILEQLMIDFRNSLEGYSLSLLDTTDQDRSNDVGPVVLDKTATRSFSVIGIRSPTLAKDATVEKDFFSFVRSLPINPDDRLKLLIHTISKELRVSNGLAKSTVQRKLADTFLTTSDGNPFDNLVGVPGNSIFDAPLGSKSLSSNLYLKLDDVNYVLPFESRYIDDKQTTFIPGNKYFIDSITNLTSANEYNVQPFLDYANRFATTVNNVNLVLNGLYDFNDSLSLPDTILKAAAESFSSVLGVMIDHRNIPPDTAVSIALFRLCLTDTALRGLMFKFLVLAGAAYTDRKPIFIRALGDQGNKKQPGLASLQKELISLADSIESRVYGLINPLVGASTTAEKTADINKPQITITAGAIKRALMNTVTSTSVSLFREFVNFSDRIDQEAALDGGEFSYMLTDGTGRTKFNFISSSYMLAMTFEIFNAMCARYTFVNFAKSSRALSLDVSVDLIANRQTNDIFRAATDRRPAPPEVPTQSPLGAQERKPNTESNLLSPVFQNTLNKLVEEDVYVQNVMHIFGVIGSRMTQTARRAANYFTSERALQAVQTTKTPASQLRLANKTFNDISVLSSFGNVKFVTTDERNLLLSSLKEKPFTDSRMQLMAIGIPAGFTDSLSNRTKRSAISNTTFSKNDLDLIKICVYRKMSEFDDLVFKPQEFTFDMALFYKQPSNANIGYGASFSNSLSNENVTLLDCTSDIPMKVGLQEVLNNQKYAALALKTKEEMFKNHLRSGLLSAYLLLATSLQMSEETFVATDHPLTQENPQIDAIIRKYFSQIKGVELPDGPLDKIEVPAEAKDEAQLLLNSNSSYSLGTLNQQVLEPKLFDRVFVLAIDLDAFSLNREATFQTVHGKQSYESQRVQTRITKIGNEEFITSDRSTSLVFDDIFVTAGTVN